MSRSSAIILSLNACPVFIELQLEMVAIGGGRKKAGSDSVGGPS